MNRYKIYYILLLLIVSVKSLHAQGQTLYGIGYTAGQKSVPQGNSYGVSSGAQVGGTGGFKQVVKDEILVLTGMPLNVSYFPVVFGEDLFVSKGYFSGYVQLQWK